MNPTRGQKQSAGAMASSPRVLMGSSPINKSVRGITGQSSARPSTPAAVPKKFIRRGRARGTLSTLQERDEETSLPTPHKQHARLSGGQQSPQSLPSAASPDPAASVQCLSCADLVKKIPSDISAWLASLPPAQRKIEEEWQLKLKPMQFKVLRMKATEPAGSGALLNWFAPGSYTCAGCALPLYKDEHKMPTTCGWPAFKDSIANALHREPGKKVPEITCNGCGGHLGHVFKSERYPLPHNERHCVNSASLKFVPASTEASPES